MGQNPAGEFTADFIISIINELKSMRKYLKDTTQIDQIIIELESMLKYAHT